MDCSARAWQERWQKRGAAPDSGCFFCLRRVACSPSRMILASHWKTPVNPFNRNAALWIVIVLLLALLYSVFQGGATRSAGNTVSYSDFVRAVEQRQVQDVRIQGNTITGTFREPRNGVQKFATYVPSAPVDEQLMPMLIKNVDRVDAGPAEEGVNLGSIFVSWLPVLVLVGVYIFFLRQMQSGTGRAMGFGKSRARLLTEKHGRVTFEDVAGIDEAKAELEEIVDFLKDPQKFQRLGGKIPKGCLLVGPPGTGKTLLARAIAGEANVPFFTISGSDFVEMFVGVGASPRARHVRAGQEERALHRVHRRNRRRRPPSWRRPGRRQRRARADAEPVAGRDGRLRVQRRRHPDRRHQPSRRARPRAAASGPLRPPGHRAQPRRRRPREDPQGPHAQGAAGAGRRSARAGARHAGLLGRRPRQPGERGRAARRARRQAPGHHGRLRIRQGQGADGHRAPLDGDDRRGEEAHGLPRGGPCAGRHARAQERSAAQGDDHPARPCARRHHAAAGARPSQPHQAVPRIAPGDHVRRPHRRGDHLRTGERDHGRGERHPGRDADGARHDHRLRHVREARPRALPGQRAGSVPGPRRDPDAERLGSHRPADRPGGPPPDRGGRGQGQADPDRPSRRPAPHRQGAARVRDAQPATRSARSCAARRSCATTPVAPARPTAAAAPRCRPAPARAPARRRAPIPSRSRAFDGKLSPASPSIARGSWRSSM